MRWYGLVYWWKERYRVPVLRILLRDRISAVLTIFDISPIASKAAYGRYITIGFNLVLRIRGDHKFYSPNSNNAPQGCNYCFSSRS
mmetsp:Transcript_15230/g.32761  ORF Transcript_15230/g.32761 Transcript_15230/m.32761 type:complete len:86 (+) Transcript_15230:572-829(+)